MKKIKRRVRASERRKARLLKEANSYEVQTNTFENSLPRKAVAITAIERPLVYFGEGRELSGDGEAFLDGDR